MIWGLTAGRYPLARTVPAHVTDSTNQSPPINALALSPEPVRTFPTQGPGDQASWSE